MIGESSWKDFISLDNLSISRLRYDDESDQRVTLQVGQYRGKTLAEIACLDLDYYRWLLSSIGQLNVEEAALAER